MGQCVMYILRGKHPQQLEESHAVHITCRPRYSVEANVETVSLPSYRSIDRAPEEDEIMDEDCSSVVRAMRVYKLRELIKRLPGTPIEVLGHSIYFGLVKTVTVSLISTSQYQFYGEMINGQRHGFGIQYWHALKSLYIGQFDLDKISGLGVLTHRNGDRYEGYWRDDQADGNGIYTQGDGSKYEGSWRGDRKHGLGKQVWSDGQAYEGQYVNGLKEGHGKLTFSTEAVYEGEFLQDQMHGQGEYRWPDGRSYRGSWNQGKMHGRGRYIWQDAQGAEIRSYDGEYKEGKKHGRGLFTWPNGSCYDGEWANGKQHGRGTFTNTTSIKHHGIWHNGTLVRFVTTPQETTP